MKKDKNADIQEFMQEYAYRLENISMSIELIKEFFIDNYDETNHAKWYSILNIISEYTNDTYKNYCDFGLDNGYLE